MPGKTARSRDQTSFGTAGTPEATAQPTCGFPGTPPSAIVHTVPEFIWEMSVQTPFSLERHHGVLQGGVTMSFKLVCGERVTTLYGPERRRRFYLAVLIDRGLRPVNPDDKHAALGR